MSNLNNMLKNTIIGGLFLSLIIPFIVSGSLYFPFITGKGFFFRILIEVLFFLWVILVLRDRSYIPKKSPIFLSVSAFTLVIFLADIFGVNREVSIWSNFERMDGFVLLIHVYLFFVILISVFKTEKIWKNFFSVSVIASVFMCLYCLLQIGGLIKINQGGARVDGTFGNSIYLAVYMLFSFFISIYLIYKNKLKSWKIFYGVAALLQLVIIYFTATRGAVVGLVGGVILSAIVFSFLSKDRRLKKISFGVIVGVVTVVGLLFIFRGNSVISENPVLGRLTSISLEDKTTLSRLLIWNMAWQGFLERPILGYGQGNFNIIFDSKYNPVLHDQEKWFDRAHSIIFDWLIAGGLLGLLSYLSIYFYSIFILFKNKVFSNFEKSIIVGLLSAYFFQNLFAFDTVYSYIMFMSILGYIYFVTTNDNKKILHTSDISPLISNNSLRTVLSATCIVFLCATVYFVNVPAIKASNYLVKTSIQSSRAGEIYFYSGSAENHIDIYKKALSQNSFGDAEIRTKIIQDAVTVVSLKGIEDKTKSDFVDLGFSELNKQILESPNDSRFPYILGASLVSVGLYNESLPLLEKAVSLSPAKQDIRYALAIAYVKLGQIEKAIDFAKQTYEINTDNDQAWTRYIQVAVLANKTDLVEGLINEAVASNNFYRVIDFMSFLITNNPTNPQLRANLSLAYAKAGDINSAIKELEKAKIDFPEGSSKFDNLILQLKSGNF